MKRKQLVFIGHNFLEVISAETKERRELMLLSTTHTPLLEHVLPVEFVGPDYILRLACIIKIQETLLT